MDFLELAKARYSCRKFTEQPVEDDKIEKIITAAIAAPSAKNLQPLHFWVVRSEDGIKKISEATPFTFGATTVIVVGGKKDAAWVRESDNRNFADVDATIAGTHIILAAQDLGLGSTWVGRIDTDKLFENFPNMKDYDIVGLFPIGYPDMPPAPKHTERKSKDDMVTTL